MTDNTNPWRIVDRSDASPRCPFCESALTEVHRRRLGHPFGDGETLVYLCPSCSKILGFGHAQVG